MIIIKNKNKNTNIEIIKGNTATVITDNNDYNFTKIGYTQDDITLATRQINDYIDVAIKYQNEYLNGERENFEEIEGLIYAPWVDVSDMDNLEIFYYSDYNLMYVPKLSVTSKCDNIMQMFYDCQALNYLDVSDWDTTNISNMYECFANTTSLKTIIGIENWDTNNLYDVRSMFYGSGVANLDLSKWQIPNIEDVGYMFAYCNNLNTLNIENWDFTNVINTDTFIFGCSSLVDFYPPQNINDNLNLTNSKLLSKDSLLRIFYNLKDRTGTTLLTCKMGSANLAKLTDDDIAIATSKNWIITK